MFLRLLQAGLDWTGTPTLNDSTPYGPSIVAVESSSTLGAAFESVRKEFRFEGEIKGHRLNSNPEMLNSILDVLIGFEARVSVLLLDKHGLREAADHSLPFPALLRHQMSCSLAKSFIELQPLSQLICDDEIRGKQEWSNFRTEILRINRSLHPQQKLKVGAWPSDKSALVQAADVTAYVFSRSVRGETLDTQVKDKLKFLQTHPQNRFEVIKSWGR
jgi:hypothetical protein